MQRDRVILHLSLIDGIGPATVNTIVTNKHPDITWHDLYHFTQHDWCSIGISAKSATKLVVGLSDTALLEKEFELIEKHGIKWTTCLQETYPALLSHIHVPPTVLYFKGAAFDEYQKMIAIIGSRKADKYAQQVINSLVPPLVVNGWSVVSGGAIGADSMAHAATLAVNGKTIVVLGSGLLQPYPRSNKYLFDQVVENGGTLVSSFPLAMAALAGNFPARNRIIAGLSKGCIVVQAAHKSGASITAQYALDEGRDVFAIPGMIDHELSVGCHALIKEGAQLVTSAEDVLRELGETMVFKVVSPSKIGIENQIEPKDQHGYKPAHVVPKKLSSDYVPTQIQAKILLACAKPTSIDDLAQQLAMPLSELQALMFDLQLEGVIEQNFAGQWVAR
ncbi:MAG: DNA-processing protein DprA [bacterium]|nr:DNA-processing protein DprA [bacterium]